MTPDEARQLFAYTAWANAQLLAAARALPAGQAEAVVASSFPSVRATLAHIAGAEWIWLRRWLGESPPMPGWVGEASLAEIGQRLAALEAERDAAAAGWTQADLDRTLSYRNLAGQAFSNPLGELVRHVVNHSTYHRGQITTQLRQLGHAPPTTDLIAFLRLPR